MGGVRASPLSNARALPQSATAQTATQTLIRKFFSSFLWCKRENFNLMALSFVAGPGISFVCQTAKALEAFSIAADDQSLSIEPLCASTHIEPRPPTPSHVTCRVDGSIFFFVGDGSSAAFSKSGVYTWSDEKRRFLQQLDVPLPICALRLENDRLYVVTANAIHVYNVKEDGDTILKAVCIKTPPNPDGVMDVCCPLLESESVILAFPGAASGTVQSVDVLCAQAATHTLQAQKHTIVSVAFDRLGLLLATASVTATRICVFNRSTGTLVYNLKRSWLGGAPVRGLCFDHSSRCLLAWCPKNNHIARYELSTAAAVTWTASELQHIACRFLPEEDARVLLVDAEVGVACCFAVDAAKNTAELMCRANFGGCAPLSSLGATAAAAAAASATASAKQRRREVLSVVL
eukprot:m.196674 g.196674  ORF g.196674 m.196674 type:complete len:406 (-) comp21839_c0_seq3:40-1257(-)